MTRAAVSDGAVRQHWVRRVMTRHVVLAAVVFAVSGGCQPQRDAAADRIAWRILDSSWSAPWDPMDDSIMVYRIVASRAGVADTLADVIRPWPVVVSDSTIIGLHFVRSDSSRQIVSLTLPGRRRAVTPLPSDLHFQFTDIAISPHGQYLAYVASDSTSGPYPVIRAFDTGAEILRGPAAAGCDCDSDMNHARWVSVDSFEVAVVNSADDQGGPAYWLLAGNAAVRRAHHLALASEPTWHDATRP
jgi:hypothetical protein